MNDLMAEIGASESVLDRKVTKDTLSTEFDRSPLPPGMKGG
jgi:hypothetical protein